jgi:uncharacterized protein YkwD
MRSVIALSVAALAGSALAAPHYGQHKHVKDVHVNVVVETVVHTVYVTEGAYEASKPKATSTKTKPVYQAPATTVVYEPVKPTSTSVYVAPPAPTSEAPKPTTTAVYVPAPEPTTEAPTTTAAAPSATAAPSNDDYMSIISEWRSKMGMNDLACDKKLEANAMNCVQEGNGVMKHKLNAGTYGQVLAPGKDNMESFLSVFVGGWLCEIPTLPGLNGVCSTMSKGWSYEGQTGHAEILTSKNYSKIGCSFFNGIWACDLA